MLVASAEPLETLQPATRRGRRDALASGSQLPPCPQLHTEDKPQQQEAHK